MISIASPTSAPATALPLAAWAGAAAPPGAVADASSIVTLDSAATDEAVYTRPATPEPLNLWRSARADDLSTRMLDQSGAGPRSRAERWRGLGSALLHQLASTGQAYRQTLAQPTGEVSPAQALDGVARNAATLSLKLQTRSGQTVTLSIALNDGGGGGTRGLQVEVASSGPLADAEREALEQLAGGLDQALEGLGQNPPQLDLSGLQAAQAMQAGSAFSTLDLRFDDPLARPDSDAVRSLTLHLDEGRRTLAMKGAGGEMKVAVDAASPAVGTSSAKRQSAIERLLDQVDAAGERGHANARMLAAFKQGLGQLQPPATGDVPDPHDELTRQTEALESGLADFDASFSADGRRFNRYGATTEQSHMDYHLAQQTRVTSNGAAGGQTIAQTQSETSSAVIRRTRTLMLDLPSGNYDETTVHDRKTVNTLIRTDGSSVTGALRQTDEQRLLGVDSLEKHRVTAHWDTPMQRHAVERLR